MEALGQPSWFGQYRLTSRIATGGMAEVYLGRHIATDGRFGPLVAVKRLLPHLVKDSQIVRMFLNEARITAQINHPNVVRVIDLGHEAGEPYICMELLEGFTLAELRRKTADEGRRLPLGITLRILADACRGLDAAHGAKDEEGKSLGLVHRDFTPDNIHVGATGEVKVIDFGVAKTASWGTGTEPGTLKGKFFYMSPEMILARPLDHRADLFAAGVMLYEELCGRRPFTGKSVDEVVLRIAEGTPKPPRSFDPSVPESLEVICLKALEREPDRRFPSLQEFIQAIESVGGLAKVATKEEVATFLNAVFPPDRDTKRQTLRQARAADPSQPGLGIFDPQTGGQATAQMPVAEPLPEGAIETAEVRALEVTDLQPVVGANPGSVVDEPEPPTQKANVLEAGVPSQQAVTKVERASRPDTNPYPSAKKSPVPKFALGALGLALLVGVVLVVRGGGASLPPAEALAQAEKAKPGDRAKLLDGIVRNPTATDEQLDKASALLKEAEGWEALLELSEAWGKRNKDDIRPRLYEANAASHLRKGKRAEAAIAAAQDLDPKDTRADLALADLRELQGDAAGTLEALGKALRRNPDNLPLKKRYGYLLSQSARLDDAVPVLEQVLKAGFDGRTAAELAFVQLRMKKAAEAEALLKKALKKDGAVMEVHYYLGAVLYQKGDIAAARTEYLEADRLAGTDTRPLAALCEIDTQQSAPQLDETKKKIGERFGAGAAALLSACASTPVAKKE